MATATTTRARTTSMAAIVVAVAAMLAQIMPVPTAAHPQGTSGSPLAGAPCTPRTYTGTACQGLINYPVAIPATSEAALESTLTQNFGLANVAFKSTPDCLAAVVAQGCAVAYPACASTAGAAQPATQIACKSSCTAMYTACKNSPLLDASFFKCNQLSSADTEPLGVDGSCVDSTKLTTKGTSKVPATTPSNSTAAICPPPFIPPPPGVDIKNNRNCDPAVGCCLPCPALPYFYHRGDFDLVVNFQMYAALVSTLLCAYIVLSWFVLPGRKDHPGDIVLHFAIAVMLWQASNLMLLGNPRRIQCVDAVTSSTASNNVLCGIQGAWLVIMINASVFWAGYMIANLHAIIVWRSNLFERIKPLGVIICWGLPGILTFLPFFLSEINADTAIVCIIRSQDMNAYFFSIQSVVVGLSLLMTIFTTIHIIVVATRASSSGGYSNYSRGESSNGVGSGSDGQPMKPLSRRRQMLRLLTANWRSLLLSAAFLLIYITYVVHNNVVLQPFAKLDAKTQWIQDWQACLATGDQNACHDKFASNIPPYGMLIFAAALTTSVGLWLFVIFACNVQLLREWDAFFGGR